MLRKNILVLCLCPFPLLCFGVTPIVCPGTSQILIGSIYDGTAKTSDGKWQGKSAIPPQYQSSWQSMVSLVLYYVVGSNPPSDYPYNCVYYINNGTTSFPVIALNYTEMPKKYAVYSISEQGKTFSEHDEKVSTYENAPLAPTQQYPLYFAADPSSK